MKNKQTETKFKSTLRVGGHLISTVVCLGAVILICSSAPAQNLFVSDAGLGNIDEFTPAGVRTTFASGLPGPFGLAFDSAGNLLVAAGGDIVVNNKGVVYKFTPSGV